MYGRQGGRVTFLARDSTRAAAVQLRLEGGVQATISLVRAHACMHAGGCIPMLGRCHASQCWGAAMHLHSS